MDFWQRARSFAEEAARKSQELTEGFGSAKLSDVVSEASKRSKELAAEASKKSKELAAEASKMSKEFTTEALKRADQITTQIPPASVVLTNLVDSGQKGGNDAADLEKFGVTEELREFVKGITTSTFRDFPLEDDSEVSDIPMVSNIRQDLTEWQERHAKLVLSTVKEISKLRYQLCPRVMKERKFWRIYFILVNSYVAPYEKLYMEDVKLKATEKAKDTEVKETSSGVKSEKADETSKPKSNNVKPAASEQDLDVFLLGDLEDDDGPDDGGDGNDGFDDDFDKL
ncbi:hypothetical protein CDL12_21163 [Handroanthus impetiginosus]|uniref:BSD domain-containing protein n=1 Tax=Handroanthus impetiginosus TaxID=429701 RepID=A0A2G9GLV1_9LAMI|nr:hypothetical protein CDL12_21163 [Handroanthus impetiginosus]